MHGVRTVFFLQDGTRCHVSQKNSPDTLYVSGLRVASVALPRIGHTYPLRELTYLFHYLRKALHFTV
jgi:hypothetical protein